jgi:dsRNA-specific ribonuclease
VYFSPFYVGKDIIHVTLDQIFLLLQFPNHKEGDLTLWRSGLVNNKLLAYLTSRAGISDFVLYANIQDLSKVCKY